MTVPTPTPGLVICYAYLWADQHYMGRTEGTKDRPCAIVAARQVIAGREIITLVPITHAAPADASCAVELPAALKAHLGLDSRPSWVIVSETNDFVWPGPDLRPVRRDRPGIFHYGMLPPRFFAQVRDRILQANQQRRLARVERSE